MKDYIADNKELTILAREMENEKILIISKRDQDTKDKEKNTLNITNNLINAKNELNKITNKSKNDNIQYTKK